MRFGIPSRRHRHQPKIPAVSSAILPVELYRPIIEAVDTPGDLHTLLFVSKAFQFESERILYHEITIKHQALRARLKLFKHLSNCQRVAHHVRKLSLYAVAEGRRFIHRNPEKYFRAVRQTLCALHLLKDLYLVNHVYFGGREYQYPSVSLLSDCRFHLRRLTIDRLLEVDRPAMENQKYIEELDIDEADPGSIPQVTFTRLSTVSILLHHMPLNPKFIQGIKALCAEWMALATIVSTRSSFINLVSLCLFNIDPPLVIDIPLMFPSVRHVQLSFHPLRLVIIEQSMDHFQKLSNLQKIYFSGSDLLEVPTQPTVSRWFLEMPSLQSIIINARYCMEWTRSAEVKVVEPPDNDEWKDSRWIA